MSQGHHTPAEIECQSTGAQGVEPLLPTQGPGDAPGSHALGLDLEDGIFPL